MPLQIIILNLLYIVNNDWKFQYALHCNCFRWCILCTVRVWYELTEPGIPLLWIILKSAIEICYCLLLITKRHHGQNISTFCLYRNDTEKVSLIWILIDDWCSRCACGKSWNCVRSFKLNNSIWLRLKQNNFQLSLFPSLNSMHDPIFTYISQNNSSRCNLYAYALRLPPMPLVWHACSISIIVPQQALCIQFLSIVLQCFLSLSQFPNGKSIHGAHDTS